MRYIGIDPGKSGAVCVLEDDGQVRAITFHDTPVARIGKKEDYLIPEMAALIRAELKPPVFVVLEQAGAMPDQGVSSTLSTGIGYGIWLGILATLGCPFRPVMPAIWRKAIVTGLPKAESPAQRKEQAAKVAVQLYPQVAPSLRGPRGGLIDGRADALLLAHYGRKTYP